MADNWVTQDEAFAITRLLSSLERTSRDGMSIEELAELLGVSVPEARMLTKLVRKQAVPAQRRRGFRLRYWLVGGITAYAILQAVALLGKIAQFQGSGSDGLWVIALLAWSAGVLLYFRVPIRKAIMRFVQGYDHAAPTNGAQ